MKISRCFILDYESYLSHRPEPLSKEELELNSLYLGSYIPAFIPGAEINNHRFPVAEDGSKLYGHSINFEKGYLIYKVMGKYKKGEEVNMAYASTSRNSEILLKYGVAALDNMDNEVIVVIPYSQWNFQETHKNEL